MTMTTKNVRVRMMEPVRFYTKDAAPRSRDTILSPPTREELAANQRRTASMSGLDLGMRWTGDLQPVGEAVARVIDALKRVKDQAQQKQALSAAVVALADYGNESSEAHRGPFGSLAFGGSLATDRPEMEFNLSTSATPDDINAANRAFCDRANRSVTSDALRDAMPARGAHVTAADVQRLNNAFNGTQSRAQPYSRPWGNG
jgi:hypothetical protein